MNVLVVEDEVKMAALIQRGLREDGLGADVAGTGEDAVGMARSSAYDAIVLDVILPGIDGFETCRKLKREAGLSNVPVIFMTGLADTEHIVQGLEAGGVDYVTKPIAVEEMLARIRVHLANARMTQSARAALDVSGRFLLAVNREGRLMWATPQAQRLLSDSLGTAEELVLPDALRQWLDQAQKGKGGTKPMASVPDHPELRLYYMGGAGPNEFLLRLAKESSGELPKEFSSEFGLTVREAEVLSWLSKGKTNRDIAQILGLSPRTVDKHLEQIYAKLGVENRTAAAAIATGLTRRES